MPWLPVFRDLDTRLQAMNKEWQKVLTDVSSASANVGLTVAAVQSLRRTTGVSNPLSEALLQLAEKKSDKNA
jgi:hypothetical protein